MKVAVAGGPPVALCDVPGLFGGGTWNRNNVIVFASSAPGGLQRVDAAGGIPTAGDEVGRGRREPTLALVPA